METRALRKARGGGGGGGGGESLEILTWALGSNFPIVLVYPLDMPEYCVRARACVRYSLPLFSATEHV